MKVLQINNVSKTFQGSCDAAVNDLSLDVAQGEIVALLGESGCGKTNVLPAEVVSEGFLTPLGIIKTPRHTLQEGQKVLLSVRPDNFEVAQSPENALSAKVVKTNFFGDHKEIICRVCGRDGKEMDVTIHLPPHEACDESQCFMRYKDRLPPSVLKD